MPPSLELAELASIIEYVTYKQSKRTPRFLESRMSYEPAEPRKVNTFLIPLPSHSAFAVVTQFMRDILMFK